MSDGRPMNTDTFLVRLFENQSDIHDREGCIRSWLEGDWDEAVQDFPENQKRVDEQVQSMYPH